MKPNPRLLIGLILIVLSISLVALSKQGTREAKAQTITPWKFIVYSDSQYSYEDGSGHTLLKSVNAMKNKVPDPAFVVGLGDFTQKGLVTDTTLNNNDWTSWKADMSNIVTSWTVTNPPKHIGTWGDHDTDRAKLPTAWLTTWSSYMAAQKGLTAYSAYPANSNGLYGSFKHQNALILFLTSAEPSEETLITNAVTDADFFSKEETYISNILSAASADSSVKWKFVFYHNPAVACNIGTKVDNERTKGWLNDYFKPHGVDMVFNGHTHSYMRTCPMLGIADNDDGTVTCESFTDNQAGDPQGVIQIMSTPVSAGPTTLANCSAKKVTAIKRMFSEIEVSGDVMNFKAWNVEDAAVNGTTVTPVLLDSLKIDKTTVAPTPVTLYKSANKTAVKSGDLIEYKIHYKAGNQTVGNVIVSDSVPAGTEYYSGGEEVVDNNTLVRWTFNDWTAGEEGDLIFQVKVK